MKRNSIYACLAACLLFAGCEDFNDKNFDGLDEMGTITNVATYEMEYTGDYPSDGYFTSREEVAAKVEPWLTKNYFACDSGSLAKVSLSFADSLEVPGEVTTTYTLTADDYDAMGTGKGMPGQYNNFSESIDPNHYLPVFLGQKFPYAFANEVIEVVYAYYADRITTDRSLVFAYNGTAWTLLSDWAKVAVTTKIAEFEYARAWKLSKILGGVEKYVMVHDDYVNLYNWVATNKGEYLSTTSPATDEYYFGVATKYNNINNKVSTWKSYYQPHDDYKDMTDEQVEQVMYERIASGIAELVLPVAYENPQSGINYQVSYSVYNGHAPVYTMTFMYDEVEKVFYKTAGPVY